MTSAVEWIDALYRGEVRAPDGSVMRPPWEIGEPQPAVVALVTSGRVRGDVLDAGCGSGEHAAYLAAHGHRVVGVDVSPAAVALAEGRLRERGVTAELRVADAVDLEGYADAFDTVLDVGLFHALTPQQQVRYAASLHRACRPGAVVHVVCFSRQITVEALRAAFGDGWDLPEPAPGVLAGRVGDPRQAEDLYGTTATADGRFEVPAWLASATRL